MVSNISCLRVFAVCFGLLAVFRELLFFSLSPFLRLVSSVQAIMASSAGYIIACSCEDIIEDQWVSAEDMWQDITENILVWVYMQGSVFYYIQHCFTWVFVCFPMCMGLSRLFSLVLRLHIQLRILIFYGVVPRCVGVWKYSLHSWVFLRMCYSSNAHLMSV